jgi:hypothetical protein
MLNSSNFHRPGEYLQEDPSFALAYPKLSKLAERYLDKNAETNRLRYARAIAAENNFGHEVSRFSEDRVMPFSEKDSPRDKNLSYSVTQILLSPVACVRIFETPHFVNEKAGTKYRVDIIEKPKEVHKVQKWTKADLECLVGIHAMRAGTIKERANAVSYKVDSLSLSELYDEFKNLPASTPRTIDKDSLLYAHLGREKVSKAVNAGLWHDHILNRVGLCLPDLLKIYCEADPESVRTWAKRLNREYRPCGNMDLMRQMGNLHNIGKAETSNRIFEVTLALIEKIYCHKENVSKTPYVDSLLTASPALINTDISRISLKTADSD